MNDSFLKTLDGKEGPIPGDDDDDGSEPIAVCDLDTEEPGLNGMRDQTFKMLEQDDGDPELNLCSAELRRVLADVERVDNVPGNVPGRVADGEGVKNDVVASADAFVVNDWA